MTKGGEPFAPGLFRDRYQWHQKETNMGFIDELKRLARPYEDEDSMDDFEDDFD